MSEAMIQKRPLSKSNSFDQNQGFGLRHKNQASQSIYGNHAP